MATPTAAKIQSWEIAGVSVYPVVQAMLALDIPARLGLDVEQFLNAVIGLFTLAAIIRGFLQRAHVAQTTVTVTGPAATTTVELPATEPAREPKAAESNEVLK